MRQKPVLDFDKELRGDDEEPMNVKGSWLETIVTGLIVGVIVAGASRLGTRSDDTRDQVIALRAQFSQFIEQFKQDPYVGRDEFTRAEGRLTGLEQRVGNLERTPVERGKR